MAAVLFICTGNLCRSPSAEWFLTQRVRAHGPDGLRVSSAGTLQASVQPPPQLMAEGAAYGLDLTEHQPRKMESADVTGADLVLGMTREHAREVVVLDREAFGRTFTLRDFVRRAEDVGPRRGDEPLEEWTARVHAGRRHLDLVGESSRDDVADPMGGPAAAYRAMLEEVSSLTDAVYALVWGAAHG
jgi:protein-tyrosine phosphatase